MPAKPKKVFLSSDMIDPIIRDECWRDISRLIYEISPWDLNGDTGFRGTVSSRPFGSMTVGTTTFNDQKVWRTRQTVVRSTLDLCVVQLVLSGQSQGDFDGADVAVKPGDILVHDLTQTMDSQVTAGARLSVVVARSELQRLVSRQSLHGIVLPGQAATTRLLSEYMVGLDKVLVELPQEAVPAAQEALLILLASAINGRDDSLNDDLPINLPMRQRIIDYVDRHIMDPRLTPQVIMGHFRLSRSHLYRSFAADGGVANFIRDRRLDMAYRLLSRGNANPLSNKAILHQCGLSGGANFARMFGARFNMSPSDARDGGNLISSGGDGAPLLHNYLHEHVAKIVEY